MATNTPITNEALGALLGVSFAQVSRIRSGNRLPGLATMTRIREILDWSIDDQTDHRNKGDYPEEFERRINERYGPASISS